jgi:mRNA-degrading endonuclease YafQ of YafQ-DinJ toxin-antitoxin module
LYVANHRLNDRCYIDYLYFNFWVIGVEYPEIHGQYRKTLELLEFDPYHPSLRFHSLQGNLSGLSSVSINISYRIVLELMIEGNEILLINIGKHDQVY